MNDFIDGLFDYFLRLGSFGCVGMVIWIAVAQNGATPDVLFFLLLGIFLRVVLNEPKK